MRRADARVDDDTDREIESHLEMRRDYLMAGGMPADEAMASARARFGDLTAERPRLHASARRRSRLRARREWFRGLAFDAVLALRQLRCAPAFALGVVLSLGFGIGVTAVVYSWAEGMVLRPLPAVREIERLVSLAGEGGEGGLLSLAEYREWQVEVQSVSDLAAAAPSMFAVDPVPTGGESLLRYGLFVTPNYFEVLGVRLASGRPFLDADDSDGSPVAAVVSDRMWRDHFGGAPDLAGRIMRVNGREVRIVGVAPPRFAGHLAMARFDLFLPVSSRPVLIPADRTVWDSRDYRWLDVMGRLAAGGTVAQADAEFSVLADRYRKLHGEPDDRAARAVPLDIGSAPGEIRPLMAALVAITIMILFLICSNVANLMLTRAAARTHELAVRVALGASRLQVIRQLMVEVTLLAVVGATVGLLLASNSERVLVSLMPPTSIPLVVWMSPSAAFFGVVLAATAMCIVACGVAPSLLAARLAAGGVSVAARISQRSSRSRTALVASQFAIALAILTASALLVRRSHDIRSLDLGFYNDESTLLMEMDMARSGIGERDTWGSRVEEALARMSTVPGVSSVAAASFVPLGLAGYVRSTVYVPGQSQAIGTGERVLINGVTPEYFALMGISLLEGRGFTWHDGPDQPPVVIVNRAFAARYFAGNALHRTFTLDDREVRVVGVVADTRHDLRDIDSKPPLIHYSWQQAPTPVVTLHIRRREDRAGLPQDIQAALRNVDPGLARSSPQTLHDYTRVAFGVAESGRQVLLFLGSAALILASLGLFSVIAYATARRRREFGIRLALGATPLHVSGIVLEGALRLVGIGVAAGLFAAASLTMVLRSRVPEVPAPGVLDVVVPVLILTLCAVAAAVQPARRAAALDPLHTLRTD